MVEGERRIAWELGVEGSCKGLLASWLCLVVLSAVAHLMTLDADLMLTSAAYASPKYRVSRLAQAEGNCAYRTLPWAGFPGPF